MPTASRGNTEKMRVLKGGGGKRETTAKDLLKYSDVELSSDMDSAEQLEALQKMMIEMVPIAHGLFMKNPRSTNAYAFSALVEKYQSIIDQRESSVDYEVLSEEIVRTVIEPILEKLVLDLGMIIKTELRDLHSRQKSPKARKKSKAVFDSVFIEFGKTVKLSVKEAENKVQTMLVTTRRRKRK